MSYCGILHIYCSVKPKMSRPDLTSRKSPDVQIRAPVKAGNNNLVSLAWLVGSGLSLLFTRTPGDRTTHHRRTHHGAFITDALQHIRIFRVPGNLRLVISSSWEQFELELNRLSGITSCCFRTFIKES